MSGPDTLYAAFAHHVYDLCAQCQTGELCDTGHRLGQEWYESERLDRERTVAHNLMRDRKTDLWDALEAGAPESLRVFVPLDNMSGDLTGWREITTKEHDA